MHTRYSVPAIVVPAIAFGVGSAVPASAASTIGIPGDVTATDDATTTAHDTATSPTDAAKGVTDAARGAKDAVNRATDAASGATQRVAHHAEQAPAVDQAERANDSATRTTRAATQTAKTIVDGAARATPTAETTARVAGAAVDKATQVTESAQTVVAPSAAAGSTVDVATRAADTAVGVVQDATNATSGVTAPVTHTAGSAVDVATSVTDAKPVPMPTPTGGSVRLPLVAAPAFPDATSIGPSSLGPPATSNSSAVTSTPTVAPTPWLSVPTTGGAIGPTRLVSGSSVPAFAAWSSSPTVAAPNGTPVSPPGGSALGRDVATGWEVTPLDPVRIVRRQPASEDTVQSPGSARQEVFFGWFGRFMAHTGANLLRLLVAAMGLVLWGMATLTAGRRLSAPR